MKLEEKKIGIIGFGNVGKRFAEMCISLNLKVMIFSKYFDSIKADFPQYISSSISPPAS